MWVYDGVFKLWVTSAGRTLRGPSTVSRPRSVRDARPHCVRGRTVFFLLLPSALLVSPLGRGFLVPSVAEENRVAIR